MTPFFSSKGHGRLDVIQDCKSQTRTLLGASLGKAMNRRMMRRTRTPRVKTPQRCPLPSMLSDSSQQSLQVPSKEVLHSVLQVLGDLWEDGRTELVATLVAEFRAVEEDGMNMPQKMTFELLRRFSLPCSKPLMWSVWLEGACTQTHPAAINLHDVSDVHLRAKHPLSLLVLAVRREVSHPAPRCRSHRHASTEA